MLGHAAGHSADGALHFVCMDWRHLSELLTAGRAIYDELKNLCVWPIFNSWYWREAPKAADFLGSGVTQT